MSRVHTIYGLGGYDPEAPDDNVIWRETIDLDADTYTREEGSPLVITEGPRPLTAEERLLYDPPPTEEEVILAAVTERVLPPEEGTPERETYDQLAARLADDLAAIDEITSTANQLLDLPRRLKDLARIQKRTIRRLLRLLDSVD